MRIAERVTVVAEERVRLEGIARSRTVSQGIAKRSRCILLAASGATNKEIAQALGMGINGVTRWRQRFTAGGVEALFRERPRTGRKRRIPETKRLEVVEKVTGERPTGRTHWSRATLAKAVGVSESTVGRILKQYDLKPHILKTFKLSNDKHFEEKLRDVVGLYVSPPQNAVVFSVDEKTQIQALDRRQPGLPIKKGKAGTMTHDYKRNGTTTLFAALNVLTGAVISDFGSKHTNREWLQFLKKIDRQVPEESAIHVICDNYATHKHPNVQKWLERNPRFHVHFTATSASWMNLVERFFRDLTVNALRRGVFTSVPALIEAIDDYLIEHNRSPKPFVWTANVDDILAKVARAREALMQVKRQLEQRSS